MHIPMKKVLKKTSVKTKAKKPRAVHFDAISIFPEVFGSYVDASILGRAQKSKLISFKAHNLRYWTHDRHHTVDDKPFGGGPGMVMKPEPFHEALVDLGLRKKKDGKKTAKAKKACVIMTAANGKPFTHADAIRLSKFDRIVFLCGRYEGIDQRVIDHLCDESFRIGEYVLTGGELPAMVMMDSISRQIPGVLGKEESLEEESWTSGSHPPSSELRGTGESRVASRASDNVGARRTRPCGDCSCSCDGCMRPADVSQQPGTGEYPQYTRPEVWLGHKVPEVLMSGNHAKIKAWREGMRKR